MVANFDIFPTEEIFDAIFVNQQSSSISGDSTIFTNNFQMAGYQSSNVIKNIKSFFIYSIIIVILALIYQMTKRIQHKFSQQVYNDSFYNAYCRAKYVTEKLSKLLVYGAVIRIIIEGYLSISLATFIGLASIQEEEQSSSGWPVFNIILSILLLLLIIIAPFALYFIVLKNSKKLKDSFFAVKYQTLYEELAFEKKHALAYILVLFSKRFIMTFVIVVLRVDFVSQILGVMISSLLALVYYIRVKPFNSLYLNYIEIFNESCFLTCAYMTLLCTDVVPDAKQRFIIGWAFFGVIIGNLTINFAGIVYTVVIYLMKLVKKLRYLMNSYEQSLKAKQMVKINPELNNNQAKEVNDFEKGHNSISVENSNEKQMTAIVLNMNKFETNDESIDESSLSENQIGFTEQQQVVRILPETFELEEPNIEAQKQNGDFNVKYKVNRRKAKTSIDEIIIIDGNSTVRNQNNLSRDKITLQHEIKDIIGFVDEFLKKESVQNQRNQHIHLIKPQEGLTFIEEEYKIEDNSPSTEIKHVKNKQNSIQIEPDLTKVSFVDESLHLNSSHKVQYHQILIINQISYYPIIKSK